ncbi:hypothetical protein [Nodosilinea sp. P-1105]|uniref:hypothetical protein n=1 Tax=Nodosilinea sp. P-1105 TaxID=2546229 RepID=UPI00146C4B84|nr:hypothetical protein [Nodosilinea sp. P-1105]NMF82639.1 hypothetical protein [Nodosilinea sp. P-1105]
MLTLSIILSFLIFLDCFVKAKKLYSTPIFIAFFLRLSLATSSYFDLIELPSSPDAAAFLRRADTFSYYSWGELSSILSNQAGSSAIFPALGALVYKTFGFKDPLAITILFSVCFGTLAVAFTYYLSEILVGSKRARQVIWIIVFFPPIVLNSSVYNREALCGALFTLGLYYVARWWSQAENQKSKISHVVGAVVCFILASWIHGGYVFVFIGLLVLSAWEIIRLVFSPTRKFNRKKIVIAFTGFFLLITLTFFAITSQVSFGKVGNVADTISSADEVIDSQVEREGRGGSVYPDFAQRILPVRVIYFLFSPFPWDIRSARMLQGFIATAVFLYIAISIFKSIRGGFFRGRNDVRAVSIVLAISIFVFAVGTRNIGTSIRHRSKFLYGLLGLSAATVFKSDPSRQKYFYGVENNSNHGI